MAYLRFLTDNDYKSVATDEHMKQLIRDEPERFSMAEKKAEMQLLEYLDQYYEIEKVLAVGKNIRAYNHNVSYPGRVYIKVDEEIFKTLQPINGLKRPTKNTYWKHVVEFIDPCLIDHAKKYSQLGTFSKGEVVKFGTEYWQCLIPHGFMSQDIHLPGVTAWKEAEIIPWEPNLEWEKNQVCSYEGEFYQYIAEPANADETAGAGENDAPENQEENEEDEEVVDEPLTPANDDNWGLIAEYDEGLEYAWDGENPDYVVADDTVFYPILNPNPDKLEEGINITRDDPRNPSIVAHMCNLAVYHLHMIISPTNVSETRRWAYQDSLTWLYNASKFKINPQLPRKREHESCLTKVDWAISTFQRDYNVSENAWLI